MTRTRKQADDKADKNVDVVEKAEELTDKSRNPSDAPRVAEVSKSTPQDTPKKSLGAKEVIPFEWKLVGESQEMILTLFKAVERAEVEAQLERVRKEGYYTDLRIVEASAKIKQRRPVLPPKRTRKVVKTDRKAAAPAKTKKTAARSITPPKRKKAATPGTTKKTTAAGKTASRKAPPKRTAKTRKKKTAAAKSARKTTTRRKK